MFDKKDQKYYFIYEDQVMGSFACNMQSDESLEVGIKGPGTVTPCVEELALPVSVGRRILNLNRPSSVDVGLRIGSE